jgi:hypothetical protein
MILKYVSEQIEESVGGGVDSRGRELDIPLCNYYEGLQKGTENQSAVLF